MLTELASPVAATALADLYRQQELEVPILVPRDGPIAALDPDKTGLLARDDAGRRRPTPAPAEVPAALVEAAAPRSTRRPSPAGDRGAASRRRPLVVVAERAAWVRVYLDNGTIIFERILEKGETYSPPEGIDAPLIWAGNSGLGLRPGRRHPARAARPRHPRRQGRGARRRSRSSSTSRWSRTCPR